MDRYRSFLYRSFYLSFSCFWILAGLAFFALEFDLLARYDVLRFLRSSVGSVVLYVFGAFSLAGGLYFLQRFISLYRDQRRFVHQSEFGMVKISPYAVRELATEILRSNLGLSSFHIGLSHLGDGISIKVRATVNADTDIGDLGEQVQTVLRNKIKDRTGLSVERIDFYTQGVQRAESAVGQRVEEESASTERVTAEVSEEGATDGD